MPPVRDRAPGAWRDVPSAPDWGRPGLSRRSRTIARAVLEALLCDRGPSGDLVQPDDEWCRRVLDGFDAAVGNTSAPVRLGLAGLLRSLEWLPPLVIGGVRPLSRLSLARRLAFLEALEHHGWALLPVLLLAAKVPMVLAAFESGEALARTGFDRPNTAARRQLAVAPERQP
jgi:hypothetical protein